MQNKFILSNVSANADSGFNMNRHLLMHKYDIAGGRNIGTINDINARHDISATRKSKGILFRDNINLNFYW